MLTYLQDEIEEILNNAGLRSGQVKCIIDEVVQHPSEGMDESLGMLTFRDFWPGPVELNPFNLTIHSSCRYELHSTLRNCVKKEVSRLLRVRKAFGTSFVQCAKRKLTDEPLLDEFKTLYPVHQDKLCSNHKWFLVGRYEDEQYAVKVTAEVEKVDKPGEKERKVVFRQSDWKGMLEALSAFVDEVEEAVKHENERERRAEKEAQQESIEGGDPS